MGECTRRPQRVLFDRRAHLESDGAAITSDAGLLFSSAPRQTFGVVVEERSWTWE